MLVVETVRIETAVLLNEVARTTFDSGGGETAPIAESAGKQQGLATYLALLEHVINVIVDQQGTSGCSAVYLITCTINSIIITGKLLSQSSFQVIFHLPSF